MNCTHCGKKLYPEAPFCPHCGKPNEHRTRLEQQVNAFDRAYEQTTNEVRTAVRRKNRFIGKIVAIAFLTLLLAVTIILGDSFVSELTYRKRTEEVTKELDATLAEINGYLDAQDYYGLYAWCDRFSGISVLTAAAPEYDLVLDNVRDYCETMSAFMDYHELRRTEGSSPDMLQSKAKRIRDELIYYYRGQKQSYRPDDSARTDAVEQMNRNLEALLTAYFAVPPEETATLSSLSEGAREVLLENYLTPPEAP